MMDLRKFEPLWERAPELHPGREEGDPLEYMTEADGKSIVGWWCGMRHLAEWQAAALIRDKAMWWLAKSSDSEFVIHDQRGNDIPGEVTIFYGRNDQWVEAPDPTEALRLAVCQALEIEA